MLPDKVGEMLTVAGIDRDVLRVPVAELDAEKVAEALTVAVFDRVRVTLADAVGDVLLVADGDEDFVVEEE